MSNSNKSYLVFQCYGNEDIFNECLFALLTFSQFHSKEELANLEIWLYTDNSSYFESLNDCWLPLNYRSIDKDLLKKWRGGIDFVHRVKIEVLKDFTKDRQGNVLYLDTDITFLQPITSILQRIASGERFMHVMEGTIESEHNVVNGKLKKYLQKNNLLDIGKEDKVNIPLETAMWNAGVLGFKIGTINLNDVLKFTESVYKNYPKHIVEQFAFSYFFQENANIKTTGWHILHYWNFKGLRLLLHSFFEHFKLASWDELIIYSQLIQIPVQMQIRANYLEYRSHKHHLVNKKWQPEIPDWDNLLHQL